MRNSFAANPTSVGWQANGPTLGSGVPENRAGARAPAVDPGCVKLNPSSQSNSARPPASAVEPVRVAIVIASKLERLGWSIVVDRQEDLAVAGQFSSFESALAFLGNNAVDVALIDEAMLAPGAWRALGRLSRRRLPKLLILARYPAENPFEESQAPVASRHLLKGLPAEDLLAAIREAVGSPAALEAGRSSGSR